MRASKRLFLIFFLLSIALILASLLAVWFYRPTTPPDLPDWAPMQVGAPTLASGRRAATYNLLLVGRDRASAATDVMALVSYDVANQRMTILQLPRDTLVARNGHAQKLNSLFAEEKRNARKAGASEKDAEMTALLALGNLLEESLCVAVDYHALVYLDGFVELINTIGGVTMDVPFPMHYDDPAQNLHIHLDAGVQHLDGAKAEQFVRFRKGNGGTGYAMGDLGRLDAQKRFAAAVLEQVQHALSVPQLPTIMRTLLSHTRSDLSLSDCVYFGKHALGLSPNAVTLVTLPGYVVGNDYVLNREGTLALLNAHFNVYETDIPDRAFDAHALFNLPTNPAVDARYHGKSPLTDPSTAEDLQVSNLLHKSGGATAKERTQNGTDIKRAGTSYCEDPARQEGKRHPSAACRGSDCPDRLHGHL